MKIELSASGAKPIHFTAADDSNPLRVAYMVIHAHSDNESLYKGYAGKQFYIRVEGKETKHPFNLDLWKETAEDTDTIEKHGWH